MATRSNIGILNQDGSVEYVYCHWDGYPSHNGRILKDHYTDEAKVRKLIANGAISTLGEEIGEQHDFDERFEDDDPRSKWTRFYNRDRNEKNYTSPILAKDLYDATGDMEEWFYLFVEGEDVWLVANYCYDAKFVELTDEFIEGDR